MKIEVETINDVVEMISKPVLGSNISDEKILMALCIDKEHLKKTGKWIGLTRQITKREGNVDVPGYVDRSKLWIVESKDGLNFKEKKPLDIKGIENIVAKISEKGSEFIGLEDPDIITEGKNKHVYFTIAFRLEKPGCYKVYLGHAFGKDLNNLKATEPALSPPLDERAFGFKELCPIPNSKFVFCETGHHVSGSFDVSSVALVKKERAEKFKFLKVALYPENMNYSWCSGHLSPCRIFDPTFIEYKGKLVGLFNGRETERNENGKRVFGKFRPGLVLINKKTAKIEWIAPEPLFEDPDATTITFASDFVQTGKKQGRLYAHINDSFVRAYRLDSDKLKAYLDEKFKK